MTFFRLAIAALCIAALIPAPSHAQAPPSQFTTDTIYNSPNGITTLAFDHAGRMLAAEKQGRLMLFEPDGAGGFVTPPSVFADLRAQVDPSLEAGLLGLEFDPDYADNRYLYVFYTTAADQRVVRLTANTGFDAMQPGTQHVLLSGLPRAVAFHKAGDLHFSPADPTALYVALGDDGVRSAARNPDRYEGKLLRIDAATGQGLPTNPFFAGNADTTRARVWAIGLRNPFRFTFHPQRPSNSVLYSSENGDATDRLSRIAQGSDGAWNQMGDNGGFLSPPDPNHRVLATSPPFVVGVAISPSGPFGTDVLYQGFATQAGFAIRRYRLTGANLDNATPLDGGTFLSGQSSIDLKFGSDGHLYGCLTRNDASTTNGPYPVRRVRFVGGTAPVAAFSISPSDRGVVPFTATFTDQSTDDGAIVGWQWVVGEQGGSSGSPVTGSQFTVPGRYEVSLTVTDDSGLRSSTSRFVHAMRATSIRLRGTLRDGRNLSAPGLATASELRFYEADGSTPLASPSGSGPDGNAFAVPAGGAFDFTLGLQPAGDAFVVSAGEPAADGVQPARRGFRIPAGNGPHTFVADWLLSDTMIAGRVRGTRETPLSVDVGIARNGLPHAIAGGRDFLAGSGFAATGVAHRVVSDALGWFHLPLTAGNAGDFVLDAVADTGGVTHARIAQDANVAAGEAEDIDLVSGLWFGGDDCDDLDAIPPSASIDYTRDIQPLWDAACTGCHVASATNSFGLDLTAGFSLGALVGTPAIGAPGVARVAPGEPWRSFLMEKINCNDPQAGTRMRPANPMSPSDQALIRDWIAGASGDVRVFGNGFE